VSYSAIVIADSVSPDGKRLTSMACRYPRFIHAELLTHRALSRSSASSRAIPVQKLIEQVKLDPVEPVYWGKNQAGMQAREELRDRERLACEAAWRDARHDAVRSARELFTLGAHKQIVNRLLEPWMWITVIVTATDWANFFALRCHEDAQPEMRRIAELMRDAMRDSEPRGIDYHEWHLPFVTDEERADDSVDWRQVSAGRCARVSYLSHDGRRDVQADLDLYERLRRNGHLSPLEHVATPVQWERRSTGNFRGWLQLRKNIANEDDFSRMNLEAL
jgi:thymidylate synthase ThyX